MSTQSFFKRFFLFGVLLIASQVAFRLLVGLPFDSRKNELDRVLAMNPEVLILGDSVAMTRGPDDLDSRTIPEMLQRLLPDLRVGAFINPASNIFFLEEVTDYVTKQSPSNLRYLIFPINPQAFSSNWYLSSRYQFERTRYFLRYDSYLFRVCFIPAAVFRLLNLNSVDPKVLAEKEIFMGGRNLGPYNSVRGDWPAGSPSFIRETLYLSHLEDIDERNPPLRSLIRVAKNDPERSFDIVFYITPVDFESGEHFAPGMFMSTMEAKLRFVVSALKGERAQVLDLSQDLPASSFYWEKAINGHLRDEGRMYVASEIAKEIQKRLSQTKRQP